MENFDRCDPKNIYNKMYLTLIQGGTWEAAYDVLEKDSSRPCDMYATILNFLANYPQFEPSYNKYIEQHIEQQTERHK